MNIYRLIWAEDRTTTHRNMVNPDARPTTVEADSIDYASIENRPFALRFWNDGDEEPKLTLFELPSVMERISRA